MKYRKTVGTSISAITLLMATTILGATPALANPDYDSCYWTVQHTSVGLALRETPSTSAHSYERMPAGTSVYGSQKPYYGSGLTWLYVQDTRNGDQGYAATAQNGVSLLRQGTCYN